MRRKILVDNPAELYGFKVALVGLGMAVVPHAKSLADLRQRVEVAYAYSPSAERRAKFAAQFPLPLCDRLETILEDRSIGAVLILTPPNTHLELVQRCAPQASTSCLKSLSKFRPSGRRRS